MSLAAKWPGKCAVCSLPYAAGSQIAGSNGRWGHVTCMPTNGGGNGQAEAAPVVEAIVEIGRVRYAKPGWVIAETQRVSGGGEDAPATIACVGALPEDARPGDRFRVSGSWQAGRYGRELRVRQAIREVADGQRGVVALLTATVRGCGDKRAARACEAAGGHADLLRAILAGQADVVESALHVAGLSQGSAREGAAALIADRETADSLAYLASLGLGPARCATAIERWGGEARQIVEADPYTLIDLPGVGWATADQIGRAAGVVIDDPRRARAAAAFALSIAVEEGHTRTTREALCGTGDGAEADAARQTGVPAEALAAGVDALLLPREVVTRRGSRLLDPVAEADGDRIAPAYLAHAEREAARHLRRILAGVARQPVLAVADEAIEGLHEAQATAVRGCAEAGVVVVTGGPGVGKTHVSRRILDVLQGAGLRVACCAPTGKAALRLADLTGRSASTIHRLLVWSPVEERFQCGEADPIDADAVLVDEASMVDVTIAASLFAAIRTGARLILVGDVDQLPSVAPGAVLRDVIESGCCPVARLTRIYRQASESAIPYAARDLNEGRDPECLGEAADVRLTEAESGDAAATGSAVVEIAADATAAEFGVEASEVQVLCPTKKGDAGVEALNRAMQRRLNPLCEGRPAVYVGGGEDAQVQAGDRVIHTRNNYDLGVMNGEVGIAVAADPAGLIVGTEVVTGERERAKDEATGVSRRRGRGQAQATGQPIVIVVEYPSPAGRRVVGYTKAEAKDLHLAYAITIHKAQGSAWPVIVVVAHLSHSRMLERSLIYTAVTRAEKAVWIVGQRAAVARAAKTVSGKVRRTTLCDRISRGAGTRGSSE